MKFSNGYISGFVTDEDGKIHSINMRIVWNRELKQILIRHASAYRCEESFEKLPLEIELTPIVVKNEELKTLGEIESIGSIKGEK